MLATLAKIVIARLFGSAEALPVAVSGGVFHNSALVRQVFTKTAPAAHPQVSLSAGGIDPVQGALALARRNA